MCAGYGSEVFYATVGEKSPVLSPKAGGDGGILSSFFRKFHIRCHFFGSLRRRGSSRGRSRSSMNSRGSKTRNIIICGGRRKRRQLLGM